jgi:hypothetical protein
MENLAEKFLLNISNQIKTNILNTVHGPFYIENFNIWMCAIDVNKPTFGSLKFILSENKCGQYSTLTFEFYSEENHELLLQIFKKTENLLNTTVHGLFQSEGCITVDWKLELSYDKEVFIFLCKTLKFFQKFFILIKDLGLITLKKSDELYNRNNSTFAYTRKKKLPKKIKKSRITLLRKTCPAFAISTKSYYYISQKNT